mmetsp:Transcript_9040/g.22859  ORF Transcript_9040/g.22859 Transcript_9040/m.22859 type:complete len:741 (+) Transcript_9040:395-2617(+)
MMSKNTNNNDFGDTDDVEASSEYKVRRLFAFPTETATATTTATSSSSGITDTTTGEETATTSNSIATPAAASMPNNTYPTTGWYRDPITGRFTNDSNEYNGGDEEGDVADGDSSNVVGYHELVPESNGITPIVTYQEEAPFYPIRYSCESAITANAVGNNGQIRTTDTYTDANSDTTNTVSGIPPSSTTMSMVELSAPVELEFLLPTSIENVEENVDALQWSILKSLAERFGLSRRCDLDRQHGGPVLDGDSATSGGEVNEDQDVGVNNHSNLRRRRRNRQRHLIRKPRKIQEEGGIANGGEVSLELQYPTSIYAVGSNPEVEWTETCHEGSLLRSDMTESSCYSMQAVIDVVYRGDPEEKNAVEAFIQSAIQEKMHTNPGELFVKNVGGIHMVPQPPKQPQVDGDQTIPEQDIQKPYGQDSGPITATSGTSTTKPTTGSEKDGVAMYIIVPVVAAFVIMMLVGWTRWQNKKKRYQTRASDEKVESLDLNINAASSETTDSSISPTNDKTINSQGTVDKEDEKSSSPSLQGDPEAASGLPPRPPRRKTSSTNLKKKRRKKKKKKVVALKRVNSRENITEMPTISESLSEGDDESECDSEYTGEDDSSYDASSGCITPVGSLSRSSSRASSPKLSPVRDSEEKTNSFVIEAPDFPHLLQNAFAKNAMKPSTPVTPVTGGTDRDLPPLPPLANRITSPNVIIGEINENNASARNLSGAGRIDGSDDESEPSGGGLFFLPWLK